MLTRRSFLGAFAGAVAAVGAVPALLRRAKKVPPAPTPNDGLCNCSCADPCPFGKTGSMERCVSNTWTSTSDIRADLEELARSLDDKLPDEGRIFLPEMIYGYRVELTRR